MSFTRPTIVELIERIEGDFRSKLSIAGAILRRAMVGVLSRVIAGAAHLLHGHLEFLGKQLFPDTSEDEFFLRQASTYGFSQNPADYAHASLTCTGINTTVIPAGSLLISGGNEYSVDADATISGTTATALVTALVAGSDGTLSVGATLNFESPISGISSSAVVAESTQDGTDQETIEELRTRFLEFLRTPSHGGSANDYSAWAKQVSGVTRVWVYPLGLGPGTVLVRFVRDDDVDPIPSGGEVTEVQDYIDVLKPAHATVTVAAPTADTLNVELGVTPNTTAMKDAVEASILDFVLRVATPRFDADTTTGKILYSQLFTAIGATPGLTDFVLVDPVTDYTSADGYLVTDVSITWD